MALVLHQLLVLPEKNEQAPRLSGCIILVHPDLLSYIQCSMHIVFSDAPLAHDISVSSFPLSNAGTKRAGNHWWVLFPCRSWLKFSMYVSIYIYDCWFPHAPHHLRPCSPSPACASVCCWRKSIGIISSPFHSRPGSMVTD